MRPLNEIVKEKPWFGWLLFLGTMLLVFILGLFASSIMERRAEAIFAYTPIVDYDSNEPRNEVWGQNFPRQYQSFINTSDTSFQSKHGGGAMIDMLDTSPELVILWAGYSFSKDYNQGRGHYYSVEDIWNTLRTGAPVGGETSPQPNTCWTCKSPDVPRLMSQFIEQEGDFTDGVAAFYKGSWETLGSEVVNSIGCADCHDAATMNLRISRPALLEAFNRTGKDINKVSHQEMRSLVCAQCHVEYYFNKEIVDDVNYLVFPWDEGYSAEDIESYYDDIEFTDWTHQLSRAPMLKAQHPDYELYLTGTHASRGVSCADCHLPYISEGGQKFTNHHIQSPLNNIASSCQVCHREETERLVEDVYLRQDKIIENRHKLEELLVRAHLEAKEAWDRGATDAQMSDALIDIRHAQWRWDFVAASHGGSFHSPVESSRILSTGITIIQEARLKIARVLANLNYNREISLPDINSKAKAQAFIELDISGIEREKASFLEKVVPVWIATARERESAYMIDFK